MAVGRTNGVQVGKLLGGSRNVSPKQQGAGLGIDGAGAVLHCGVRPRPPHMAGCSAMEVQYMRSERLQGCLSVERASGGMGVVQTFAEAGAVWRESRPVNSQPETRFRRCCEFI